MDYENLLYSLLAKGFGEETYRIKFPHSSFVHEFVFRKDCVEWHFDANKKVVLSRCENPEIFAEDVLGFMHFMVLNYLQLDEQDYEYLVRKIVSG